MTEEELRYPSLRVVMQYLEANKRIQLVQRCPVLEHVDKAVPLSLNFLYLGRSRIYLNNNTYQIGVIRQYPIDGPKILKEYERVNNSNGSDFDLDQFGKIDRSANQVLTPGDIPVESAHEPLVDREGEEENVYMDQISRRLAHLKTLRKMKERQAEKKLIEALLYEWNLRRENKYPPYSMYLKYTRIYKDNTKKVEYLEYNRKLHVGEKYMYNMLFAGRKQPLRVRHLQISTIGDVLRLPESFKINARILNTGTNFGQIYDAIQPILAETSVQEITIQRGLALAADLSHPMLAEIGTLCINQVKLTDDMFRVVLNSMNKRFDSKKGKLTKEEYIELIEKMISDRRQIGTFYSFGVNKSLLKSLYKELKSRGDVKSKEWDNRSTPRFSTFYYLRVSESSCISIYCFRNNGYNEKTRENEPYTLWLRVGPYSKKPSVEVKKGQQPNMITEEYVDKINEMIATDKQVGACHSIEVHGRKMVRKLLNRIAKRKGVTVKKEEKRGCTRFPLTYRVSINECSKCVVHIDRNSNLNKKGGSKVKPWILWVHIERSGETTSEDYATLLDKLITDKNKIGTTYLVGVQTIKQVKKLLSELRKQDGVTISKQNRGSAKFPYAYSFPINDTSKLVVFCDRKKHYNEKDSTDKPWVLWHCVEKVVKKSAAKS